MPTAVWTGTLSFGLVTLPVRLYPATQSKDVRFHLYDRSGRRVRYRRFVEEGEQSAWEEAASSDASGQPAPAVSRGEPAPADEPSTPDPTPASSFETPIAWEDVIRGQENELGDVVALTHEEIEQVRPQRSRSIDIEDFVELSDIDPVYFEKSYYVVPASADVTRPYVLLHRAMREAGRIGIGRFVLRTKPHLVAIRPLESVLAVETLYFGDEVRDPATLMPDLGTTRIEDRELDVAVRLIDTLKTEWNPDTYSDTYREELLRILSEKAPRHAPPLEAAPKGSSAVEELMAALKQSVEAAKQQKRRRPEKAG